MTVLFLGHNPRFQAKGRVGEVALCDDAASAPTRATTSRLTSSGCRSTPKRVLTGAVAVRARDLLRQIAAENDLHIVSGKVAADHVHLFISYRAHQNISQIVQWLKGTSSRLLLQEFPHLKRQFWGRHFWARGYFASVVHGSV